MSISMDEYWDSLTQEQKDGFNDSLYTYLNEGVEPVIEDAVDIWYVIPKHLRGERPE